MRGSLAALDGRALGRLRLGEELGDPQSLGRDARACIGDDRLVEPEALRRLERVRRARTSEDDAVQRLVRLGGFRFGAGGISRTWVPAKRSSASPKGISR